jgi:hypothetical protein
VFLKFGILSFMRQRKRGKLILERGALHSIPLRGLYATLICVSEIWNVME